MGKQVKIIYGDSTGDPKVGMAEAERTDYTGRCFNYNWFLSEFSIKCSFLK